MRNQKAEENKERAIKMRNRKIRSRKLFLSIRHLLFSPFIVVWLILPQGVCLGAPYTLTITANNGSVRVNPDKPAYDEGEKVELIPKPDRGYCFSNWQGDAQGKRLVLTLTMDSDKTIIANFETWKPPIGIPMPEFGIFETYRMYDEPTRRNPALTYTQNTEGGYYTHYIDSTHPNSTDTSNPYGTASKPRKTIPIYTVLPEGSIVEVHGGPYTYGSLSGGYYQAYFSGTGTKERPIFIRGAGGEMPVHNKMEMIVREGSSYIIIENFDLNDSRVRLIKVNDHISMRNLEIHGAPPTFAAAIHPGQGRHIVIYNNYMHDNGDPDWYDENDAVGVKVTAYAEYVWIVDNHIHGHGGDSLSVASGTAPIEDVARYVYIGRNIMHEDGENAVDLKTCADVIVSENIMYGYDPTQFLHSGSDGTAMVVNDEWPQENIWVIYNEIYNSTNGIRAQHGGKCYLVGNVIHDTHASGGFGSSGIVSYGGIDNVTIVGNTMYNLDEGIYLGSGTSATADIANNIVAKVNESFNHITIRTSEVAQRSIMHHNLLFQPNGSARIRWAITGTETLTEFQQRTGKGEGCIEADPLFVDAINNDFHLQPASPAIDNGTLSDVYQTFYNLYAIDIRKDIEGRNRPQGSGWDIGAYEYTLLPVAVIQNEPKQGYTPLNVSFDGSQSKSPHGDIVSYEWDFGDGVSSQEKETSHTYTSPGEYTVTLKVTDTKGYQGQAQTHIVVLEKEKEFGELPPGCYNNVFNPTKGEKALIVVELPKQAHVRLNLYNTRGDKIRELADEEKEADIYKYYWDGKDDSGNVVGSGLYFAHIQAGDYKKTKKIVVVK